MLKVLRPLVHNQLFTIEIPSLRLIDWNQEPLVPQLYVLVHVEWPKVMFGGMFSLATAGRCSPW